MFGFFRVLRDDLALPTDNIRHQNARKKAFIGLSLMVGLVSIIFMPYFGLSLLNSATSAIAASISTLAFTFLAFTPLKHQIRNWIDDIIHPPQPVNIPFQPRDIAKAKQYKEIVDTLVLSKSEPISIQLTKDYLKQLFNLRPHMPLSKDQFEAKWEIFQKKLTEFKKDIITEKEWNKIENLTKLKELSIDAVILSDMMFSILESDIRAENNQVTTKSVAHMLADSDKSYHQKFLNGALVELYNFARGSTYTTCEGRVLMRSKHPSESIPSFYEPGLKNDARKIYNVFIKHGFYQRYGNKAFKKELAAKDVRFDQLIRKDSKRVRKFKAFADL